MPLNWHTVQRLAVHLLLAAFLANAANKFFVPDLDYEAAHSFYGRIFAFTGDAPDQYRILTLLPLKALCGFMPFHSAALVYNFLCALLVFELFWVLMRGVGRAAAFGANVAFAAFHAYAQYTGWRPDTMALVLLTAAVVLAVERSSGLWRAVWLLLGVVALAFARADLALALGVFWAVYRAPWWWVRICLPLLPVGVQLLLQQVLFADAVYYTKAVMVLDNLSGYYLIRNPATALLLATFVAFAAPLRRGASWILKQYPYFAAVLVGYVVLVFVLGRLNEYRLFLPFWPLLLMFWSESRKRDESKAGIV